MSAHIDHAAEAREVLRGSMSDPAEVAQVHATLALVEQQRIANLIALGDKGFGAFVVQDYDGRANVREQIRKGLGL